MLVYLSKQVHGGFTEIEEFTVMERKRSDLDTWEKDAKKTCRGCVEGEKGTYRDGV